MSYPVDPNSGLPPSDPGANPSPQNSPPMYPPYPPAQYPGAPQPQVQYPGAPQPPTPGYPAQPQGPYPYGGYPPAHNPYAYPPPPQPRRSNTTLLVVLGIVGVVVIGACVACGIFAGAFFKTASKVVQQYAEPYALVDQFCSNETSANYSAAYDELSAAQQANMTRDQFISQSMALDTSEGTVTDCQVDYSNTNSTNSATSATIGVLMTRSSAGDFSGTLTLISDGTTWTIDQIDPALPILTAGTPIEQSTATPTDLGTATPTA